MLLRVTCTTVMATTLNTEDLQAIANIFDERIKLAINTLVPPMIETANENLKRMIARGFAEVDERIKDVYARLDRIEQTVVGIDRAQKAEIRRVDKQELQLIKMRKTFHAA